MIELTAARARLEGETVVLRVTIGPDSTRWPRVPRRNLGRERSRPDLRNNPGGLLNQAVLRRTPSSTRASLDQARLWWATGSMPGDLAQGCPSWCWSAAPPRPRNRGALQTIVARWSAQSFVGIGADLMPSGRCGDAATALYTPSGRSIRHWASARYRLQQPCPMPTLPEWSRRAFARPTCAFGNTT